MKLYIDFNALSYDTIINQYTWIKVVSILLAVVTGNKSVKALHWQKPARCFIMPLQTWMCTHKTNLNLHWSKSQPHEAALKSGLLVLRHLDVILNTLQVALVSSCPWKNSQTTVAVHKSGVSIQVATRCDMAAIEKFRGDNSLQILH